MAQTCQGARPGPERPPACVRDRGRTLGSTPREAEPLADRKRGLPAPRAVCGVRPSLEGPQFTPPEPRLLTVPGRASPSLVPASARPPSLQAFLLAELEFLPLLLLPSHQVLGCPSRSRPDT